MPDFELEHSYLNQNPNAVIAGIDEAGRGPWAGPVVAAAVVLDAEKLPADLFDKLDDSKRLTVLRREELFSVLCRSDAVHTGVGQADVNEIDEINILEATYRAITRALKAIGKHVDLALVDGNRVPSLSCRAIPVVKGDSKSLSIAAASVIAKVTRDRLMIDLANEFPGYGWETNMGYGTAKHQAALARLGVTPHHRRSFAPIRAALNVVAP